MLRRFVVVALQLLASVHAAFGTNYIPFISEPKWMIPASNLPPGVNPQPSNNCVAITIFQGLLFIGWR